MVVDPENNSAETAEITDVGDGSENEIVAEPRKPNNRLVIGLFVALLVAAGVWFLMYGRKGPAKAEGAEGADGTAEVAVDPKKQAVSSFLQGGAGRVALMEKMLRETEKVVQQFLDYPSMKQIPLDKLQTNPFRIKTANSAPSGNESESTAKRRREEERQAILKAVQSLGLQSIIHSDARKACMINNAMYTEGQQVEEFVVEKINPGAVIVRSGVYRFELKMQK